MAAGSATDTGSAPEAVKTTDFLDGILKDPDESVRSAASDALQNISGKKR